MLYGAGRRRRGDLLPHPAYCWRTTARLGRPAATASAAEQWQATFAPKQRGRLPRRRCSGSSKGCPNFSAAGRPRLTGPSTDPLRRHRERDRPPNLPRAVTGCPTKLVPPREFQRRNLNGVASLLAEVANRTPTAAIYVATADIYVVGHQDRGGEVASILTGHFCVLRGITTCCKFHHRHK
jgi:hypothetical protein